MDIKVSPAVSDLILNRLPNKSTLEQFSLQRIMGKRVSLSLKQAYSLVPKTEKLHLVELPEHKSVAVLTSPIDIQWSYTFYSNKIVFYPYTPQLQGVRGYTFSRFLAQALSQYRFIDQPIPEPLILLKVNGQYLVGYESEKTTFLLDTLIEICKVELVHVS